MDSNQFFWNVLLFMEKAEVTVYAYGRKLEPDEQIIVPANHRFYNVLDGIANEMLDKEEGVA